MCHAFALFLFLLHSLLKRLSHSFNHCRLSTIHVQLFLSISILLFEHGKSLPKINLKQLKRKYKLGSFYFRFSLAPIISAQLVLPRNKNKRQHRQQKENPLTESTFSWRSCVYLYVCVLGVARAITGHYTCNIWRTTVNRFLLKLTSLRFQFETMSRTLFITKIHT